MTRAVNKKSGNSSSIITSSPHLCLQDFYFVREFARFGAALLAKAPHEAFDLLLGGMAALQDELRWFQVGVWQ